MTRHRAVETQRIRSGLLGRAEEDRARLRGAEDARDGRPINEVWMWRRKGVAQAYREGYMAGLPGGEA